MNRPHGYRLQMKPWGGEVRWHLLDPEGEPVPEAERFLHTLMLRGLAPRTRRTYAYDLLCAYRWMEQNDLRPEQVSGEEMLGFIAYQQQPPPAAPSTINRRLRLLQRLVGFITGTTPLIPAWQHQGQPLHFHARSRRGSLRLKEPHRVVHPLKDAEALEFFGSLKTWRDRLITLLMWAEGLRSMEVLNLCLDDIDLHHRSLHIKGKGRKQRVMPLAEPVAKALLLYVRLERPQSTSPRLLLVLKGPHRGRPLSPEGLRRTFRYHRAKSGVTQVNPHRLRHLLRGQHDPRSRPLAGAGPDDGPQLTAHHHALRRTRRRRTPRPLPTGARCARSPRSARCPRTLNRSCLGGEAP